MDISIRKAIKSDLPDIYSLVRELAIYENAPNELTATIEDYERDFDEGVFESHIAIHEKKVVGMMVYYMSYSTWKGKMLYLEDFVITEHFRKKGIGLLLFEAFLAEAKQKGARLCKWQVLDWNVPAIQFYEKYGATIEKDWWTVKFFL